MRVGTRLIALAVALAALCGSARAAGTIRAVMHSDLKIIDPVWTAAYITRNHGYMVYDTLLALDAQQVPRPQMVDGWTVSDDRLTWTFSLREGLLFHDGAPVTAVDAVASIRRWAARDAMGQMLMSHVAELTAPDARTFTIKLATPYGLVLESLAKPSSNVPFVMPARVAATPPEQQIDDATGSGPFVFRRDQWRPGALAVYERFDGYKPRAEPPSWGAGGKVVNVDRVEWVNIPDPQTALAALENDEVDLVEAVPHDLLPLVEGDDGLAAFEQNPLGNQYFVRFNSLWPPFDNPKIRRAALLAFKQEDVLRALVGDPRFYRVCAAMFVCGTPLATDEGGESLLTGAPEEARRLLREAGYDGTPVVLLHSTDLPVLANLAPVGKQALERVGFKVEMVDMDWQSVSARVASRARPAAGGWNAFMASWGSFDVLNPLVNAMLNTAGEKGWVGWFDDPELEAMKTRFAEAPDAAAQRAIAAQIQLRALTQTVTHAYLGEWRVMMALRRSVQGMLPGPAPYFWNVRKEG